MLWTASQWVWDCSSGPAWEWGRSRFSNKTFPELIHFHGHCSDFYFAPTTLSGGGNATWCDVLSPDQMMKKRTEKRISESRWNWKWRKHRKWCLHSIFNNFQQFSCLFPLDLNRWKLPNISFFYSNKCFSSVFFFETAIHENSILCRKFFLKRNWKWKIEICKNAIPAHTIILRSSFVNLSKTIFFSSFFCHHTNPKCRIMRMDEEPGWNRV